MTLAHNKSSACTLLPWIKPLPQRHKNCIAHNARREQWKWLVIFIDGKIHLSNDMWNWTIKYKESNKRTEFYAYIHSYSKSRRICQSNWSVTRMRVHLHRITRKMENNTTKKEKKNDLRFQFRLGHRSMPRKTHINFIRNAWALGCFKWTQVWRLHCYPE